MLEAGFRQALPRRVVSVVSLLVLLVALVHFLNFSYDDAFISFRYADNFAHGQGLVFNPGERVEGYSNFSWTLFMGVLAWLGSASCGTGMLLAAKAVGTLCSVATLLLLMHAARIQTRATDAGLATAPVAALYLAMLAPFAAWSMGGLETPVLTLLLPLALAVEARERAQPENGRIYWSAWLLWLAAITRPEPILLVLPFAGIKIYAWRRAGRPYTGAALRYVLTFLAPFAGFLLFRFSYYGQLLPNTYFAKLHADVQASSRGLDYVLEANRGMGLLGVLAASLGLVLLARRWSTDTGAVVAVLATHVAGVAYEGGDWMVGHRLLVPILPLLALLVQTAWLSACRLSWPDLRLPTLPDWVLRRSWADAWHELVGRAQARSQLAGLRALRSCAGSVLLGTLALSVWQSYRPWLGVPGSGWAGMALDRGQNFEVAYWMREHVHERGLLATGEAGVIPCYTRLPLLDLFGLMDPHIARLSGARHKKYDAGYVLSRSPRYVVLTINRFADGSVTGSQTYAQSLLFDAEFLRRYRVLHEFSGAILYERLAPR
jgi:arabinofuranosyltransferase